jgi:hypothetical protein
MLAEIHAMMTEMAMKGGFAYSRWKEGLSVMIPKQPGARTVDNLRAILLFEGDFNWANKENFCRSHGEASKAGWRYTAGAICTAGIIGNRCGLYEDAPLRPAPPTALGRRYRLRGRKQLL